MFYAYTIQPEDTGADGVTLETDVNKLLTEHGKAVFANRYDSNVSSRPHADADIQSSSTDPVDGTQAKDCDILFCAYMDVQWGFPGLDADQFAWNPFDSDWLTGSSFDYGGEDYNLSYIVSAKSTELRYDRVRLFMDFQSRAVEASDRTGRLSTGRAFTASQGRGW